MRYLSLCSGIEAATVAWEPLGWEAVGYSEIEDFPDTVLARRWPQTQNLGDMTKFKEWPDDLRPDLLVGGTPCQSFSVAGLRKGLDDPRGQLALVYLSIARRYQPCWIVWENVPGVLSADGGRAFGSFLGGLAELGYGFAYRVLDAQFFGVAQRRRRVFVVGYLGDWRRAAAVLFESSCLQGNPPPSREKGQGTADRVGDSSTSCCEGGLNEMTFDRQSSGEYGTQPVASTVSARDYKGPSDLVAMRSEDAVVGALACNTGPRGHDAGNFACNQSVDAGQLVPMTLAVRGRGDSSDLETRQDGTANAVLSSGGGRGGMGVGAIAFAGMARGGAGWAPPSCPMAEDVALTLDTVRAQAVAVAQNQRGEVRMTDAVSSLSSGGGGKPGQGYPAVAMSVRLANTSSNGWGLQDEVTHTLDQTAGPAVAFDSGESDDQDDVVPEVRIGMQVRRLTPKECERLQGFPDDYTKVCFHGKRAADGSRYKSLGNSMAVPVMRWIGRRIQLMEALVR